MSHIMYVGGVGMGKTALAVLACQQDKGDFVYTNIPLNAEFFPNPYKPGETKGIIEWTSLDDVEHAHCGVWFMDEADMWLDSRKFSTLNDIARRKLKEHRKDDIRIISTTQHVSFVDRVFRILCDEVRVVQKRSWPFIGWIWPSCVRPDMYCAHCGRLRPDGQGDARFWWQRWLGFGTIYTWDVFPASVLGKDESASAADTRREEEDVDEEGNPRTPSKRIGHGHKLFNMSFAAAYDTSCKASQKADAAMKLKILKDQAEEDRQRNERAAAAEARREEKARLKAEKKKSPLVDDTVDNP